MPTDPLTPERLAEIRERAEKADHAICHASTGHFKMCISPQADDTDMLAVKVFREDIPVLLAEVERLQHELMQNRVTRVDLLKLERLVEKTSQTMNGDVLWEEIWMKEVARLRADLARLRKEAAEMWLNLHAQKCVWAADMSMSTVECECGQRNPYAEGGG